jgi:hypothetical protein
MIEKQILFILFEIIINLVILLYEICMVFDILIVISGELLQINQEVGDNI